jgi:hypothetical protein
MAVYPYKREIRPALVESLGEHVDREYEKIERALRDLSDRQEECCAAGGGSGGAEGIDGGSPDRVLGGTPALDGGSPADR